jgi:hypothetical protein
MAERGKYRTPAALRAAIEARLRDRAIRRGIPYARVQLLFLMDRLMARLAVAFGDRVLIKGGFALELRLEEVRATRDIDLQVDGPPVEVIELRRAGRLALGDRFSFEINPDRDHPTITGPGVRYGGTRYRVMPWFAGKMFGRAFGLDLAVGGLVTGPIDEVRGDDLMSFVGIEPGTYRLISRGTHIAEKLHAYTLPREGRLNTRIKDLPDLALLGQIGEFEGVELRQAIAATFEHRATHEVPLALPPPPNEWAVSYQGLAAEDGLQWTSLASVFDAASSFVDGALGSSAGWDPARWSWSDDTAPVENLDRDGQG